MKTRERSCVLPRSVGPTPYLIKEAGCWATAFKKNTENKRNLIAMASNLRVMASNPRVMAFNLLAGLLLVVRPGAPSSVLAPTSVQKAKIKHVSGNITLRLQLLPSPAWLRQRHRPSPWEVHVNRLQMHLTWNMTSKREGQQERTKRTKRPHKKSVE